MEQRVSLIILGGANMDAAAAFCSFSPLAPDGPFCWNGFG